MVAMGEHGVQADIMFVIEGTAINGAYLNDLKTNYLIPTLEFFSQGTIEDRDYVCEVCFACSKLNSSPAEILHN